MVKSLKIAASCYTVSEVAKAGADFGTCDHIMRHIRINKRMSKRDRQMTLLHEAIHAICQEYGISQYFAGEAEELVVRSLEVGVANLFRENKAFARELIETLSAN